MHAGEETRRLEELLRARGTAVEGNEEADAEIRKRYETDCAVLILDSSGFTRITKTHGIIHFLALIVSMRDVVRAEFEQHGAQGHWAEADNMYAVFAGAKEAVQCALAVQAAMAEENGKRGADEQIQVCIGIGAGRVLRIGGEDVFGDQMNLASKLGEDIAEPGEVLITDAAYQAVKDRLDGAQYESRDMRMSGVEIQYQSVTQGA